MGDFTPGQLFSFLCLVRQNAALKPRRKSRTVLRHLRALRICADWVDSMDDVALGGRHWSRLLQWSADVLQNRKTRRVMECPPRMRVWDSSDGVLRDVLHDFAKHIARIGHSYREEKTWVQRLEQFSSQFPALSKLLWGPTEVRRWDVQCIAEALQDMELSWQMNDLCEIAFSLPKKVRTAVLEFYGLRPVQGNQEATKFKIYGRLSENEAKLELRSHVCPVPVWFLSMQLPNIWVNTWEVVGRQSIYGGTLYDLVQTLLPAADTMTGSMTPNYLAVMEQYARRS